MFVSSLKQTLNNQQNEHTMPLTHEDLEFIKKRGSTPENVEEQIKNFERGFPFIKLERAASINDGILQLSEESLQKYIALYDTESQQKKIIKFVPASGAASRMFKDLFQFAAEPSKENPSYEVLQNNQKFAFSDDLKPFYEQHQIDPSDTSLPTLQKLADYILEDKGLSYGSLPKGMIKFHQYDAESRTAFEEHLVEGAHYAVSENNAVFIHFTVAEEHQGNIKQHIEAVRPKYEERYDVRYHISYSIQDPATDTIAVNMDNTPFRDDKGEALFRPGGHGALLQNLNQLDGDLIFIKNIDNVVPDRLKPQTYTYKKALGGYLLALKSKLDHYLKSLKEGHDAIADEAASYLEQELGLETKGMQKDALIRLLDRPIRICGMVKNEGEPGGGPFWVANEDGSKSLQIVEPSQVDADDQSQKDVFSNSTHFSPVDIACSTRDYTGKPYDLNDFQDPNTGFISYKSKYGRELKAQELPGLWNGGMAYWNTLFIEVPVITFNPVKTVNDLLREQHQ
jgi:hypothetical protein